MVVEQPGHVSVAAEDCLKVVYAAREWHAVDVTVSHLRDRLGVGAPAVSEMVRRLREQGLVTHEPYGPVALTDDGKAVALRMLRRHRLIETYLVDRLGYTWDEVHDEAERLEHVVSGTLVDRMAEKLGHPDRDPHGDPIPRPDGTVVRPSARPLAEFTRGEAGLVARVSDADPELLRYFAAHGIDLDERIEVVHRQSAVGSTRLRVGTGAQIAELDLTDVAGRSLWLARTDDEARAQ